MNDKDDQRLAMQAATGDPHAFEALVGRHYDRIHALAWKFTGGPPDSEDLAQDVCIALGRKIRSFRGEARFHTWLRHIAVNKCRNRRLRDRRRAADRHTSLAQGDDTPTLQLVHGGPGPDARTHHTQAAAVPFNDVGIITTVDRQLGQW